MTKCSEVMTRHVVCALPDDTVSEVAQLMKREDIGPIPIVEDENTKKLVGIVTDRDLALKVVAEERDPKHWKRTNCAAFLSWKMVIGLWESLLRQM